MKKLIITIAIVIGTTTIAIGQCTALYSFTASSDTVSFSNLSSVSNAHYFWNFGDGTGSDSVNPVHAFPGTGGYMVTLFAKDTVSNCSTYYEQWVDVIKPSAGTCHPGISDSIYTSGGRDWLMVYDTSMNCNQYWIDCGNSCYLSFPLEPILLPTSPYRMVCSGIYFDTTNGHNTGEAFKTAYHNYSSSHNYGDSSANFEFTVVAKNVVYENLVCERILYKAMNKTATSYKWFTNCDPWFNGDSLISTSDTVSQLYPSLYAYLATVGLVIQTSTGYHDTIYQNIMTGDSIAAVLGVNDVKNNVREVKVYPNPNNGQFTFAFNTPVNGTIEIYDITGQKVYSTPLNLPQGEDFEINLRGQPDGIYFYRAITNTGNLIGEGKVVVQK